MKYALRAFLHAYPEPEMALKHLNDFICETHELDKNNRETFIVLALVVINTATGETTLAAAGCRSSTAGTAAPPTWSRR